MDQPWFDTIIINIINSIFRFEIAIYKSYRKFFEWNNGHRQDETETETETEEKKNNNEKQEAQNPSAKKSLWARCWTRHVMDFGWGTIIIAAIINTHTTRQNERERDRDANQLWCMNHYSIFGSEKVFFHGHANSQITATTKTADNSVQKRTELYTLTWLGTFWFVQNEKDEKKTLKKLTIDLNDSKCLYVYSWSMLAKVSFFDFRERESEIEWIC